MLPPEGEHRPAGQSPAIAEFLEERYPSPPLAHRAQVREMQNLINCDIHPLQNLRLLKFLRAEYGQDDAGVAASCRRWIGAGVFAYEALAASRSADGRYSVGDTLTLADAWLVPQIYNANRFEFDLGLYPTIRSIAEHHGAPAVNLLRETG